MRAARGFLALACFLSIAPAAHAADISLSTRDFSPRAGGTVGIQVALPSPDRVGLQLVGHKGVVGWIARPLRRRFLRLNWRGDVNGRRVPDGRYRVRLARRSRGGTLAATTLRIDRTPARLLRLRVFTLSHEPFAGDRQLLTTISPNGDRRRDTAKISFTLDEPATVSFEVDSTLSVPTPVFEASYTLARGHHTLTWFPNKTITPRTYLVRLTTEDAAGNRQTYGAANAETGRRQTSPVIRVLGVDAGFTRESYVPGEVATLRIETDADAIQWQVFHAGPEAVPTYDNTIMNGVPVSDPITLDWSANIDGPATVPITVGSWQSGLYYVKLTANDGRIGFAPFIVRPAELGATRVAIIMPTNTWQAYNFRDENGNGWGDTWYAKGSQSTVRLGRAFWRRGVPPHYRQYDLGFLRWLSQRGKQPDFLSETDLELLSADTLAKDYDLLVFAGHHEYVTDHEYDVTERFRDLGGNLIFLSSNNFFWRVHRSGDILRRTRKWRDIGRPESSLIGVQYRGNDDGRIQRPFIVRAASQVPWLFAGTGLTDGSSFGPLGGYGIEIDATSSSSPAGTIVIAEIPDIYGPGFTAQMTYYETPEGAKVFAAGALDFGGTALEPPVAQMLDNLWNRVSQP